MFGKKNEIGIVLSILVFTVIWLMPQPVELSPDGKKTLAFIFFAVIWWTFGIMPVPFTTLLLVLIFILARLAPPEEILKVWTTPLVWLIFGSYQITNCVVKSGLARRIAFLFISRGVSSYVGIVFLSYVLSIVLSIFIPLPFPRALLIFGIIREILALTKIEKKQEKGLALTMFAGLTTTSTVFLTGDSLLNIAGFAIAGVNITWLHWLLFMGVPGLVISLLMASLCLYLFPPVILDIDNEKIKDERAKLGSLKPEEIKTLCWVVVAVFLWSTDFWHGINLGWITLLVAIGLGLPYVGESLTIQDIGQNGGWDIIVFLAGASSIGVVANKTGLASWAVRHLLTYMSAGSIIFIVFTIVTGTLIAHMFIGSSLATMSIVLPAILVITNTLGINPIFSILLVYTTVAVHFILPVHQATVFIGASGAGLYTEQETIKLGVPLTVILYLFIFIILLPWWKLTGLW